MLLRPDKDMNKCLISSPVSIVNEYDEFDFLITPAFPNRNDATLQLTQRKAIFLSRYYYICAFRIESPELYPGVVFEDYHHIGNFISIALSVFYGKRFDNHGLIESHGIFSMPIMNDVPFGMRYYYFGSNNQQPRKDLSIELDFSNCKSIINFLIKTPNNKLKKTFLTAGKFYLSSLQSVDTDMEKAFLDLVTAGEILSNFREYSEYEKDELYDENLKKVFENLRQNNVNQKDIKIIKNRLYQVKTRFIRELKNLLNQKFFDNTENLDGSSKLTLENIETSLKAVYDLRSRYVHTGIDFGHWLIPYQWCMNEFLPSGRVIDVDDKELKKILFKVPTYIGLERIIRFALLRLLHVNDVYIHTELDNDKTED